MLQTNFCGNRTAGSGDFKVFYHIFSWRPSWSCDQHHVNNFSFLVHKSLHTKFGSNGSAVSMTKASFNF